MRLELILRDELRMQLREQGLEDISKAKNAYIESDGRISVIHHKQRQHEKVERKETSGIQRWALLRNRRGIILETCCYSPETVARSREVVQRA